MKLTTGGMEHTPSTVMVFQSPDYNLFNMIRGNRTLDMGKIKKILGDIERGTNLLKYCPIVVSQAGKKLDIVDGQHRFIVAKKIKSPVYYIVADALSLYDIARMNSNTEKWKAKDFINCYIELGNDHYKKLDVLLRKYPGLPVTTALSLMGAGKVSSGGHGQEKFQRGEFQAASEKLAYKYLGKAKAFEFEHNLSRAFLQAVVKVMDAGKYSIDELISKVNAAPELLLMQPNYKKYLTNLEEIASKGKHKRVAIY